MSNLYPPAALCELCKQIFEGCWVSKESLQLRGQNNPTGLTEEPIGSTLRETESWPGYDANSSDDGFYEEPDWVKIVTANESDCASLVPQNYYSPTHHNIEMLERSAKSGCYLCTIFWDLVHDMVHELEGPKKEEIDRLMGVVIARPNQEESFEEDIIQLELSYFVDAKLKQDAFAFTVGIILWRFTPGATGVQDWFQPPLLQDCGQDPLSRSMEQVNRWISTCFNEHEECKAAVHQIRGTSHQQQLPTRLLRLKRGKRHPLLCVCETQHLDPSTRYVTLSHCWGVSQPTKLLITNYTDFMQQVEFNSLPRTFQDAVAFSIAVGVEYLWIDSLCIIQDSRDDWQREAPLMCSVYSNSWVNFAATAARDGHGGLFHNNSPLVQSCLLKTSWTGLQPGEYLCVDETAWQRRIEDGPLNKRAWVLQERLLAPRTIHFAYDQIWWSCLSGENCCEAFPTGTLTTSWIASPSIAALLKTSKEDLISCNEAWLTIVKAYTKLDLTYGSDKLIALAGIAEVANRAMKLPKTDYLAGIWRSDLLVDLLWRMANAGSRRATTYRAPSWSWASTDGEVYFHSTQKRELARENLTARLVEAHTSPLDHPLGSVYDGRLKISGPLVKIKLLNADVSVPEQPFFRDLHLADKRFSVDSGFTESLDHEPLYHDWPTDVKELFFGVLMTTLEPETAQCDYKSEGLILEPLEDTIGGYQRIGWLRLFHESPYNLQFEEYKETYLLR